MPVTDCSVGVWSPEVRAFAKEAGVADVLEPLLEATRGLLPAMESLQIDLKTDPEIVGDRHIVWTATVPFTSAREHLASQKQWIAALCDLCPAPRTCVFRLLLMPVRHGPA